MAKVIRTNWVYRKNNKVVRTLPRRHDGRMTFNYEAPENSLVNFDNPMPGDPPKLWVAWLHRDISRVNKHLRHQIRTLFGDEMKPGIMNVFKNTVSTNTELFKVKHLIEVRPISFPHGEPTLDRIKNLEIMPDGRCIINKRMAPDPEGVQIFDPLKQFSAKYLGSKLKSRDVRYKDVYEDTVYNPANVSIID